MELCGACLLESQHPHEFLLAACLANRTVAHNSRKLEVNPLSFLNVCLFSPSRLPSSHYGYVCSFFL